MKGSNYISVQNARVHNLKNLSVSMPRNQLITVTGVSGSGKSSLVFDTLYAEGHRRYVESLSAYARQFLARMQKPAVDKILGLSPAIAIQQRTVSHNPRSTVGSTTELFDYLRLLFARLGRTISPITGEEVTYDSVSDVVDVLLNQTPGERVYLLAPAPRGDRALAEELQLTLQKGFTRVYLDGAIQQIEDLLEQDQLPALSPGEPLLILIDRFKAHAAEEVSEEFRHRLADSVQTAYTEGNGQCQVIVNDQPPRTFSERFEADGIQFEEPSVALFNPNSPFGACPTCEGFGRVMGTDPDLVIPNKHLSVAEGAVVPWQSQAQQYYQVQFERTAPRHGFRLDVPIRDLTREEYDLLWNGARDVIGINEFFRDIESQTYKVQYRVMLARYRGYALCPDCQGKRLRPEALYVKLKGADFGDLADLAIEALQAWFEAQSFSEYEVAVAGRILYEIRSRLKYLLEVGLGYLSLSRRADSLSGGETQRIHLANSLGSTLTGSLYILDEPTIGLHPRDNHRLIDTLLSLRNLGNTVILVEHDEAVMRRSDYLVDLGPHAGEHGGHLVFGGTPAAIEQYPDSLTGQYLSGQSAVALPAERRTPEHFIRLNGAAENNLRNLDVQVPTGCLTVLTGVSGSGKTSLTRRILHPALARQLEIQTERPGPYRALELPREVPIRHTEMVDQKSIGRTLRSNPVTYTNAFDPIRELFAQQPKARENRLKPMHFSFNVPGGRCDTCEGEGFVTIEMQFLPDIKLTCESCKGRRFKEFVLAVEYKGQSIYDVLQMTISEAIAFFEDQPKIADRLRQLDEVGLGYIRLGQNTSSLSGGEAQRLKLASFLNRKKEHHTVYFFDEPTTGLHFHDISILMQALNRLVDQGNTVVIIEHNLEVIKCADWLIDLGPDGGARGGQLLYQGAPEGLPAVEASHTGYYLKEKLARSAAGS